MKEMKSFNKSGKKMYLIFTDDGDSFDSNFHDVCLVSSVEEAEVFVEEFKNCLLKANEIGEHLNGYYDDVYNKEKELRKGDFIELEFPNSRSSKEKHEKYVLDYQKNFELIISINKIAYLKTKEEALRLGADEGVLFFLDFLDENPMESVWKFTSKNVFIGFRELDVFSKS